MAVAQSTACSTVLHCQNMFTNCQQLAGESPKSRQHTLQAAAEWHALDGDATTSQKEMNCTEPTSKLEPQHVRNATACSRCRTAPNKQICVTQLHRALCTRHKSGPTLLTFRAYIFTTLTITMHITITMCHCSSSGNGGSTGGSA
jgi:hypothetical protein